MTVTDCHHEKTAVQKMEHAKNFAFGKGLQTTDIDLHHFFHGVEERRFSIQKTEDGMLIQHTPNLTHRKIFAFWERFANDRHRPTSTYIKKMQKSPKNWEM